MTTMNIAYDQVLKNVSIQLAKYPTEEELLEPTQKFVFVHRARLEFSENLYKYLMNSTEENITSYNMFVPAKLNDEKVIFFIHPLPRSLTTKLSDEIYLRRLIVNRTITAKVFYGTLDHPKLRICVPVVSE
jgi:hypothetical protein